MEERKNPDGLVAVVVMDLYGSVFAVLSDVPISTWEEDTNNSELLR